MRRGHIGRQGCIYEEGFGLNAEHLARTKLLQLPLNRGQRGLLRHATKMIQTLIVRTVLFYWSAFTHLCFLSRVSAIYPANTAVSPCLSLLETSMAARSKKKRLYSQARSDFAGSIFQRFPYLLASPFFQFVHCRLSLPCAWR